MYNQTRRYGGTARRSTTNSYGRNRSGQRKGAPRKQYIHPSAFIKVAKPRNEEEAYVPVNSFEDFSIHDLLKRNVISKGYQSPSPIQDEAIPVGLNGDDIVGIANTGTGKTAAFALPLLNKLIDDPRSKALIIAPTRELAQQIEQECKIYARGSGLHGAVLIGGTSMSRQIADLKHRPSIVIGTPGRIKDHVERRTLDLQNFNVIVLDEVDRMVDMGFIADIRFLLGSLAERRQSYFFSATLDPKLEDLVKSFMNEPVTISVKTGTTSDNVHQDVLRYQSKEDKIEKLHNTLIETPAMKTLIFDETQRNVERLHKELQTRGFKTDAIHGGKSQSQRQRALAKFKQNQIDILVATDVAARGIDVVDITHVINYATPQSHDDYIHRIGRAGRAGRTGHAITFVSA